MGRLKNWLILFVAIILLSSCAQQQDAEVRLTDAKTATGVDDKYMPINVMSVFPSGTSKVFCWFSWKDAKKDAMIVAKWYYVTDDISVLDYAFAIPRKEGSGSVSLSMSEGKTLPAGLYRVNLESNNHQLKSLTFKVAENK